MFSMAVVLPVSGPKVVGGGKESGANTDSDGDNSSVRASAAVPSSQLCCG
jgi:hypothetical protein